MGWNQKLGESTGGINWGNGTRMFLNNVTGYSGMGWFDLANTSNQGLFDIVRGSISESSKLEISINTSGDIELIGRGADGDAIIVWDTSIPAVTGFHHWAAVFDLAVDTMTLYKDGAQVAQDTSVGFTSPSSNTAPYFALTGGHDAAISGGRYTKGSIYDLRIYKRALSSEEIQTIYTCRGCDNITSALDLGVKASGVSGDSVTGANIVEEVNNYAPIGVYGVLTYVGDPLSFRRRV